MTLLALVISLARRYQGDAVLLVADRSPVVNHLPIFSLLLYAGLVECQLIQLIKQQQQQQSSIDYNEEQQEEKRYINNWRQLAVLGLLLVYCALTVAHVLIMLLLDDDLPLTREWLAITVTGLVGIALLTTIWFATRIKTDGIWVLLLHALFLVFTVGLALASWLLQDMIDRPPHLVSMTLVHWILMEAILVFLPLILLLGLTPWVVRPIPHNNVYYHNDNLYSPRILDFIARRTRPYRFSNV
ncbi:hypothetical protein K492DRAFT_196892 [Lichtheimia hyalospora FSU 10163]|nr:hypothetical protein K492DRAFT_196892 [Lichtheimia hyalospora FSU 10163]